LRGSDRLHHVIPYVIFPCIGFVNSEVPDSYPCDT
jgi:hypothetical protein